jgi:hypothetical protein
MRALATAFVAVFLCLQPARAQECTHPGVVYAQATAPVPNARMVEVLTGSEAAWVLQRYNALEPVSSHVAANIAVVGAQGVPVFLLIGYTAENCTVFVDQIPIPVYQAWRSQGA